MKKILLTIILGIFLLSFAAAQTSSFRVEENTVYDVLVSCEKNGADCSASSICYITLVYPNSTILVDNQSMINLDNGFFNYSLTSEQTTPIAEGYTGRAICIDGNESAITTFNYEVTATGQRLDQPQSIVIIGLLILLIIIAIIFLYYGNKIEYLPFKIFLMALGVLFVMFTVGVSLTIIKQLLISGSVLSGTFTSLYRLMLILVSAGGIGLMIYIIVMSLRQFRLKRGLVEEDDD